MWFLVWVGAHLGHDTSGGCISGVESCSAISDSYRAEASRNHPKRGSDRTERLPGGHWRPRFICWVKDTDSNERCVLVMSGASSFSSVLSTNSQHAKTTARLCQDHEPANET